VPTPYFLLGIAGHIVAEFLSIV